MTVEASAVSVRYGARVACESVDLQCQHGQFTALCGPNGAGKTSLLKALLGLVPASGQVAVDGVDLLALPAEQRALRVAYVPQRSRLLADLSVRDVVAQGRYAHRQRAGEHAAVSAALAACDIAELGQRSFLALSGGEQQLVLIARALATGAPWLLVDEPTAALDVGHALQVLHRLRALADDGRGVLCVMHRLDDVLRWADQVVLLESGRVVASGAPQAVLTAAQIEAVYGVTMTPDAAPAFRLREDQP